MIRWKNGDTPTGADSGIGYTVASIASFNSNGNTSGNLVFNTATSSGVNKAMTINPDTRIDLETDCYIRGGVYFKADGATGTVDVNTALLNTY